MGDEVGSRPLAHLLEPQPELVHLRPQLALRHSRVLAACGDSPELVELILSTEYTHNNSLLCFPPPGPQTLFSGTGALQNKSGT